MGAVKHNLGLGVSIKVGASILTAKGAGMCQVIYPPSDWVDPTPSVCSSLDFHTNNPASSHTKRHFNSFVHENTKENTCFRAMRIKQINKSHQEVSSYSLGLKL